MEKCARKCLGELRGGKRPVLVTAWHKLVLGGQKLKAPIEKLAGIHLVVYIFLYTIKNGAVYERTREHRSGKRGGCKAGNQRATAENRFETRHETTPDDTGKTLENRKPAENSGKPAQKPGTSEHPRNQ